MFTDPCQLASDHFLRTWIYFKIWEAFSALFLYILQMTYRFSNFFCEKLPIDQ